MPTCDLLWQNSLHWHSKPREHTTDFLFNQQVRAVGGDEPLFTCVITFAYSSNSATIIKALYPLVTYHGSTNSLFVTISALETYFPSLV